MADRRTGFKQWCNNPAVDVAGRRLKTVVTDGLTCNGKTDESPDSVAIIGQTQTDQTLVMN